MRSSTPRTRRSSGEAGWTARSTGAAAPAILEECRQIRAERHPDGLPTGQAVATTAGELPARWVIHTVGPGLRGGGRSRHAPRLGTHRVAPCRRRARRAHGRLPGDLDRGLRLPAGRGGAGRGRGGPERRHARRARPLRPLRRRRAARLRRGALVHDLRRDLPDVAVGVGEARRAHSPRTVDRAVEELDATLRQLRAGIPRHFRSSSLDGIPSCRPACAARIIACASSAASTVGPGSSRRRAATRVRPPTASARPRST